MRFTNYAGDYILPRAFLTPPPMRTIISSDKAPKAIGPYSQAVKVGDFLFCSGQIPLDPATGEVVAGDAAAQARRALENLTAVLAAGGATVNNVVKVTMFLTDMADFAAVNAVYAEYFVTEPPARSTIQVAALPRGVKVEIEATAKI